MNLSSSEMYAFSLQLLFPLKLVRRKKKEESSRTSTHTQQWQSTYSAADTLYTSIYLYNIAYDYAVRICKQATKQPNNQPI